MEEKELRTSTKQRVIIGLIAVVMLVSIIAGYAAIVINGNGGGSSTQSIDPEKLAQYQQEYSDKQAAFKEATKADFEKFVPYRSEVTAYNETAANEGGVQTRDLAVGDGKELAEGDKDYLAYYVGWCADESVFDSSFDSNTEPTAFARALDPSRGMIEGWQKGVIGMKLGGIREITIPAELAYKDQEVCGGTYKPLKFIVMAVANADPLKTLASELETASYKLQYASYGIDYDELMQQAATEAAEESGEASESSGEAAAEEPATSGESAGGEATGEAAAEGAGE